MPIYLTVTREHFVGTSTASGGIPLDDWITYVSQSEVIRLVPPRNGINPFTRQPTVIYPPAGAAFFETQSGRCSIEHKAGELSVVAEDVEVMPVIREIARSLGALIRRDEHGESLSHDA